MAKTLKATILIITEAPDGAPGVAGKAVARYVVGDDADPNFSQVRIKEVSAAELGKPVDRFFADVVAKLKAEEGIA